MGDQRMHYNTNNMKSFIHASGFEEPGVIELGTRAASIWWGSNL